jgi:hypothetical protein
MLIDINVLGYSFFLFLPQKRCIQLVQVKAQFKRRSSANNVEIHIPVADDADTPKFRVR